MLKELKISIRKKEYLLQALQRNGKTAIPTNCFINKTLPGLGATYCELVAERDSIIIEPNVPVILSKAAKHRNCLAVVRGVQPKEIAEYIEKTPTGKRKILTTPESFYKITDAVKDSEHNLYTSFFLLFDECEKLVQDVHYRESIEDPMNDFYKFTHKAFVSATPILPSDPRLLESGFRLLTIVPDYEYRKPMTLITTNNLSESLTKALNGCKEDVYIFCNSLDTFVSIAHEEPRLREAVYFCSQKGIEKLKELRVKEFRTEFTKPGKINVLTGRFFSAVDMELRRQPHVILLTDLYGAPQSVIDPHTEAIQIVGRFRNGTKSITHISSINPDLPYKNEEEIKEWIKGADELYRTWLKEFKRTSNPGKHELLLEALEGSSYRSYLYRDDRINPFLMKNFFEKEYIKSLYTYESNLYTAYRSSHFFAVTHQSEEYILTDNDRLERQRYFTRKISCQILLSQLERIHHLKFSPEEGKRAYYDRLLKKLVRSDMEQKLYQCFSEKGAEFIREIDYNPYLIEKTYKEISIRNNKSTPYITHRVKNRFETGKEYLQNDALIKLKAIYKRNGIPGRVTLNDLKLYFKVENKRDHKNRIILLHEKSKM